MLGWHLADANPGLIKYGDKLVNQESCPAQGGSGIRWLVPLCGKTVDMAYLATQETTAHVVGVDGIRKALDDFSKEHSELKIQQSSSEGSSFEKLEGKKITLLKGDFFGLDDKATGGKFDAIMDRASMVAIDPSLREEYVQTISKVIKPGGKILLVTIERRTGTEEAVKKGPPFSISEAEVRRLYESQDWVETVTLLEEVDEFEQKPEQKQRFEGLTSMYELYFLVETKQST